MSSAFAFAGRLMPARPRRGSVRAGLMPLAVPAGSLPSAKPPGFLSRAVRRTSWAARAGVFTVLTMVALVFGTPVSQAQAAPFGLDCIGVPSKGNWGPEFYGSASTVLLPAAQPEYGPDPKPDMDKKTLAKNYTLYELTNGRGLLWSTYKKNADGDDKCSIMDVAGNWMAQTMFEGSKSIANFSLSIQDLAMNTAPFQDLYQGKDSSADSLVSKIYSTLWAPLGIFMITLCGGWVIVHAGTKNRQKVWKGISGMVVSLFVSALLLQGSWYTTVTSEADKMINGLSAAMTEVMLPENAGKKQADPCWLAEGVPNRAKRISSCTMYKAMMFTPWAAGQFGQNANVLIDSGWKGDADSGWDTDDCSLGYRCSDIRVAQVMAQTITRADDKESMDDKGDMFEKVADQMNDDERRSRFTDWRGANPSSRMQVALAGGVSNLILAPAIDFAALFKLFWEGFILILIIVLPIVGAVASFPPANFMIREWGNSFTIAFVLKGIAWIALTLLMAIYSMILSSSASLGVQVLMIVLVAFGLLHLTSKTMKGAKRSAEQAFEAQNMYEDVTGRAGGMAKQQVRSAARRGVSQLTGARTPSPRASRGSKGPKSSAPGRGSASPSRKSSPTSSRRTQATGAASRRKGRPTPDTQGTGGTPAATTARTRPADPRVPAPSGKPSDSGAGTGARTDGAPTAAPRTRAPSPRARAGRPDAPRPTGAAPGTPTAPAPGDPSSPSPRRSRPGAPDAGEVPRRPASPRRPTPPPPAPPTPNRGD